MDFLQCTTGQNVILLGMTDDASDDHMLLTRFMDRDTFDIGFTHVELQQFQVRISHLLLSKASLACGYTRVALEFLRGHVCCSHLFSGQLAPTQGLAKPTPCKLWLGW